tara:strand:- start:2220 stop:2714 length:495 start_codon:yes stop_codon:yes gene_type:complete
MKYIKGDVFPYTKKQLKADNPNTSFPPDPLSNASIRESLGIEEVEETAVPQKNGYKAVQGEVGIVDGKKVETWDLVPKTIDEVDDSEIIRVDRNPPEAHASEGGPIEFVEGEGWKETWVYSPLSGVRARISMYGSATEQIEYITENGLEAWQTKVAEIKARFPK